MVTARRRSGGFTLIELVVSLAIMVALLLAAAPFTMEWVDGTRQMRARSNLLEAVGHARALSMRNPYGLAELDASGNPYPVVRLDYVSEGGASRLQVLRRGANGSWETTPVWTGTIVNPGGLLLRATGAADFSGAAALAEDTHAFACVAYDNRGRHQDESGCATPAQRRIAVGVGNQVPEYVDLL